ncbi:hypothetical protein [Actinospica acidithermotolerans]|nr:hypothetical protein [Actinospica acidithermotolerans]
MRGLNLTPVSHAPTGATIRARNLAAGRYLPGTPDGVTRLASVEFTAEKDYLPLARMATMHVTGLLGLPIGRVTDLRLAVNEACALFVGGEPAGAGRRRLAVAFDRLEGWLRITVDGPAPSRPPTPDDVGWTMLCALVEEPHWQVRDGAGTLIFTEPLRGVQH